jgi:hypothetical protein
MVLTIPEKKRPLAVLHGEAGSYPPGKVHWILRQSLPMPTKIPALQLLVHSCHQLLLILKKVCKSVFPIHIDLMRIRIQHLGECGSGSENECGSMHIRIRILDIS